jgi:chaperonin GroES
MLNVSHFRGGQPAASIFCVVDLRRPNFLPWHVLSMSTLAKLAPLADRVLVRRVAAQAKTAGGILLPDAVANQNNQGEILAVGAGARGQDGTIFPMNVSVGDKVLLPEYGGTTVKVDDEELLIYKEMELLCRFTWALCEKKE